MSEQDLDYSLGHKFEMTVRERDTLRTENDGLKADRDALRQEVEYINAMYDRLINRMYDKLQSDGPKPYNQPEPFDCVGNIFWKDDPENPKGDDGISWWGDESEDDWDGEW